VFLKVVLFSLQEKSIVFSQWTSFLTLIEHALIAAKIRFVRLDGSMSQAARNAAISAFNDDNSVSGENLIFCFSLLIFCWQCFLSAPRLEDKDSI
jgi:SNF2 family DNA or RNA helicase